MSALSGTIDTDPPTGHIESTRHSGITHDDITSNPGEGTSGR